MRFPWSRHPSTTRTGARPARRSRAQTRLGLETLEDRTVLSTATHFAVAAPANATAGTPFALTLSALDAGGQLVTGYTGTIHFTASAGSHVLPVDYTFTAADQGVHTFSGVTLGIAGSETVTADDVATPSIAGSASVRVAAGAATHFAVGAPAAETTGTPFAVTLTALDQYGNQASGYRGTVHFSSTDLSAVLPGNYSFTSTDGGKHSFSSVTLNTAGTDTLTAADTGTPSIAGSAPVSVSIAVTQFAVQVPATVTAGVPFIITVIAEDANGHIVPSYIGTIILASPGSIGEYPSSYTFTPADGGSHTFSGIALTLAGDASIEVGDAQVLTANGSANVTVNPGPVVQFVIGNPGSNPWLVEQQAGLPFALTVTAEDAYGNIAENYTGTVHFTDGATSNPLPADYTFTAAGGGIHTFSFTLDTAAFQTITLTDTATGAKGSGDVLIDPGPASSFTLEAPSNAAAGSPFSMTVTAMDAYGNQATGYGGTVHLSSSDLLAVLPADYNFKPSTATGDGGAHTFDGLVLSSTGVQTITASEPGGPGLSASVSVNVAPAADIATHFAVTAPAGVMAGAPFSVTVTALDQNGNVVPGYTGTVHFTASAGSHVLPLDYTFTAADGGTHTFTGVSLGIVGAETLTVADKATPSVAGTATVRVTPAGATHFALTAPASATAGAPFSITLTALDAYGNMATGYTGTVHFTASAGSNTLPANYTFAAADAGVHTFSGVTLGIAGTETVTAADTATPSVSGSASVNVSPAAAGVATHFTVTAPASIQAGAPFSVTVTALDQNGDVVPGYRGTVHFTVSAGSHVVPADYSFTAADAGVHTFSGVKLGIAGTETLTVADTATATLTGKASVRVTPGPGSNIVVSAPGNVSAAFPFSVTLTAYDEFGNLATGYSGTVHFASSDGQAVLPADYTFVPGDGGKHTFTGVVLNTGGSQTLTVSDALTSAVLAHASVAVNQGAQPISANLQPAPADLVAAPVPAALDQLYAQVAASQSVRKGHPAVRKAGKKRRHHHA